MTGKPSQHHRPIKSTFCCVPPQVKFSTHVLLLLSSVDGLQIVPLPHTLTDSASHGTAALFVKHRIEASPLLFAKFKNYQNYHKFITRLQLLYRPYEPARQRQKNSRTLYCNIQNYKKNLQSTNQLDFMESCILDHQKHQNPTLSSFFRASWKV